MRGDNFRFVSNPKFNKNIYVTDKGGNFLLDKNGDKIKSIFAREIELLEKNGYRFLPDGRAIK